MRGVACFFRRSPARVGALAAVLAVLAPSNMAWTQDAREPVSAIRVEGSERIEPETVRSYMTFKAGATIGEADLDESLKRLFETGLFADVSVRREGDAVVVQIVENPIINRIAFEGNLRIDDEILRDEITLRPRVVYTRSRVQADLLRIIEIYRSSGRFAARVVPKVVQLPQNRVNLIFEIHEGSPTDVRRITFIGNTRFSDGELRDAIQTRESGFLSFFSGGDVYDPDRLAFDRELLRRKYLNAGYADFRVVSAVAELTPDQDAFFITFTVEEGQRYRFGKVGVTSGLRDLDVTRLAQVVGIDEGDPYSAADIDDATTALTEAAGRAGYAFIAVKPETMRDREQRRIDVSFRIEEGPRVFVERIDIRGNLRTEDRVIRREFRLVEGDAFNSDYIRLARRSLRNLGFFEEVEIKNVRGSAPDRTVIEVTARERATGEISFGGGYSTAVGAVADIVLRERNLLGKGQDARIRAQLAQREQQIELNFTEPYFLDRRLAAGFDVFSTARDYQEQSSFDQETVGFSLRTAYPLAQDLRQRWRYTLRQDDITSIPSNAARVIAEQEGAAVLSSVGHAVVYDTRDSRFSPREGILASIDHDVAGIGGQVRFLKTEVRGSLFMPITDSLTGSATLGSGYVFGLGEDIRILDRFFLGSDEVRGFALSGASPRDLATGDAVGGNWYYAGSFGVSFPLGLPNDAGIRGRTFVDYGSSGLTEGEDPGIVADAGIRASGGVGLTWASVLGPMNIDFAWPIRKEDHDETQLVRFSFGTRF
ncbi:MAG: outer membrane protein assembly factor BamA [Defluviicoccus sp.]|nr:outer membrane protein assembly factor BamA [Defluviicoccus sp.]